MPETTVTEAPATGQPEPALTGDRLAPDAATDPIDVLEAPLPPEEPHRYANDADWKHLTALSDDDLGGLIRDQPGGAELLQDWRGPDLRENLFFARKATTVIEPELMRVITDAGLANDPAVVRTAARIGRLLAMEAGDATTVPGIALADARIEDARRRPPADTMPASRRGTIQQQIDAIETRYFGTPEYSEPAVQTKLHDLYEALYGKAEKG